MDTKNILKKEQSGTDRPGGRVVEPLVQTYSNDLSLASMSIRLLYTKRTSLLILLLFYCSINYAQVVIRGKALDVQGQPIPGVNVIVKEKINESTITDTDGFFRLKTSLSLPVNLQFRLLGFKTVEVDVYDEKELLEVIMSEQLSVLNTVVITALGIKKERNELSYATQEIKGDDLNKVPTLDFTSNLSGKIAGLQITSANTLGGSTNAILRGFKSLTQSNQALFVVDGVPLDNSNTSRRGYDLGNTISDINSEDIESVNVLKGAAASALYGSRAANGVIVINTKKGKKKSSLGVSLKFTTQIGTYDKSTLPTYQREYGQGAGSAGYNTTYPNESGFFYYLPTFNSNGNRVQIVQTDRDESTGPAYDPNKLVYTWESFIPGNANYGKATPWIAADHNEITDLFETPVTNITSAVIDKSSEMGSFKLGYTNNYENGSLPNSFIRKNQINFNSSYNLTKQITVGGSFNYINENSRNRNGYTYATGGVIIGTLRQWWGTNVDVKKLKEEYFRTRQNTTWNSTATFTNPDVAPGPLYHDNFYWTLYENYNTNERDRYYGNVYFTIKPIAEIEITGRAARDHYTQLFETRLNVGSSFGSSSYSRTNLGESEDNYDLLVSYNKSWTDDWKTKLLVGGNIRRNRSISLYAITNGGLVVPCVFALSNSRLTPAAPVETYVQRGINGIFGNFAVDYQSWANIEATLRRDESSTLPEDNNSFYYPAVSGSILFSRFLHAEKWLDYAKIRANYAEVGNDAPPYSTLPTYVAGGSLSSQPISSVNPTWQNSKLKPERNKSYEFGIEGGVLNNRLNVDVTYYNSRSIDQIMPVTPSSASGYSLYYVNGGAIHNKGFEIAFNASPVRTKNFEWNLGVNWSKNDNKVVSLYGNQTSYTIVSLYSSLQLVAEVGEPYGVIRGTDYEYKDGKILIDEKGYPVLSSNKLSNIGNINPDWIGGVTSSFKYKDFGLNFLIDIKKGGDVYSADMDFGSSSGLFPETAGLNADGYPVRSPLSEGGGYLFKGVKADGSPNTVKVDASDSNKGLFPFGSNGGSMAASSFVYDASYVKLREVALSYQLPKKFLNKVKIVDGTTVSIVGRNLWIIHNNLPYADPEQGQASGNASIGYQTGAYPSVRTFAFNINLKF
ncbi:MAG: SusC/RagA family TonB-linked outer membrane protein [Candidatus Symbiothrix sp.]|nr:SusC/RagA family TonB-linked outer membrane protein [Candidatus Symbiothrix sp.]